MKKYKEAGNGEYITIFFDELGKEIGRTPSWNQKNKTGYYQQMIDWVAEGNEIEPQYTVEELAEKEAKEKLAALESQESELLRLISNNEYHLTSLRKKMLADRDIWVDMLDTWDDELTVVQDQLEKIREGKDPVRPITITAKPILNGD